ncbi:MAG: O-antigen ligase family protein [Bacteroidales bacterium]|nr:O-antigen ligase family protein [Bacteroidales bacterium]
MEKIKRGAHDISSQWKTGRARCITAIYLIFLFIAFVLCTGSGGYETVSDAKYELYIVGTILFFLILLVVTVEAIMTGKLKRLGIQLLANKFSYEHIFIALFGVWSFVSALLSDQKLVAWFGKDGLIITLLFILTFFTISLLGEYTGIIRASIIVSVSINICIILLQFCGKNPFHLFPEGLNYLGAYIDYDGAFLGTIGNVDFLSSMFCLFLPILFCNGVRVAARRKKTGFAQIMIAAVGFFVLIRAGVAAGILSLVGVIFLVFPMLFQCEPGKKTKIARIEVGLLFALLLVIYAEGDHLSGTFGELSAVLHGEIEDSFGSFRAGLWRTVMEIIPEQLLLGSGPGTIGEALSLAITQKYNQYGVISLVDTAHNEYLNYMANIGIPGLLFYVSALGCTVIRWLKWNRDDAIFSLGAGIVCYCMQAFFCCNQHIVAPLFWAVWGLFIYQVNKRRKGRGKNGEKERELI